jgi:hypothetical protein
VGIPEDPKTPDEFHLWWTDYLAHAKRTVDVAAKWSNEQDRLDRQLNPPPTADQRKMWRQMGDKRKAEIRAHVDG